MAKKSLVKFGIVGAAIATAIGVILNKRAEANEPEEIEEVEVTEEAEVEELTEE